MATADQIKALIRSHAEGDDTRFYAIAMQVAALAARGGHGRFAQELRELVDRVRERSKALEPAEGPKPVLIAQPRGELAGLLTVGYPKTRLADMALTATLRERLDRVLTEQRERARILEHGFVPLRKLLLIGPPGTGKTMTAAALAGELGLPLFSIQLDGLITKYLGETAAKLRLVFDAIESTRGVYLFDEFDALGGERETKGDVGEIRRVLNSFLQFLEQDQSCSLVLGATNHVKLLDRALFRRFDSVLEYRLPTTDIAVHVMKARLELLDTSTIDWTKAAKTAEGLSHAEIVHACEQAAKNAILDHSTTVRASELTLALEERIRSAGDHLYCGTKRGETTDYRVERDRRNEGMGRIQRRDREYWQSLVKRYEESGESRANFVRSHGVKLGTFQSWLYKIRHERAQLTTRPPCVTPQGFVEVVAQRCPDQGMRMRVGSAILEFDRLPDTRWLSELIYGQRGRAIC